MLEEGAIINAKGSFTTSDTTIETEGTSPSDLIRENKSVSQMNRTRTKEQVEPCSQRFSYSGSVTLPNSTHILICECARGIWAGTEYRGQRCGKYVESVR